MKEFKEIKEKINELQTENKSLGQSLIEGASEALLHAEGKIELRTSIVESEEAYESDTTKLIAQMGKALEDALAVIAPGGSVRRNVEAAHKAYLASLK